ncbi:protein MalY [Escherichia coli H494]|nr:protein MalY [Escherichia coli H494]
MRNGDENADDIAGRFTGTYTGADARSCKYGTTCEITDKKGKGLPESGKGEALEIPHSPEKEPVSCLTDWHYSSRDAYLSALKGRDGLSSPSVLALTAHIAAYQQGAPWLDALRVYLKDNLTYISDKMNAAFPELNWQIPQSTYLAWLDLRPLNIDDNALQKALIEQEKVAIMPGYTYGEEGRGFVRLNAGCPRSKLEKGVAGLINAIRAVR